MALDVQGDVRLGDKNDHRQGEELIAFHKGELIWDALSEKTRSHIRSRASECAQGDLPRLREVLDPPKAEWMPQFLEEPRVACITHLPFTAMLDVQDRIKDKIDARLRTGSLNHGDVEGLHEALLIAHGKVVLVDPAVFRADRPGQRMVRDVLEQYATEKRTEMKMEANGWER